MEVVVYAPLDDEAGWRLREAVEPFSAHARVTDCGDIYSMAEKLRITNGSNVIAVLMASNQDELDGILDNGALLDDVPSILIIPDMDRDTVAKGHMLRPRYLGTVKESFKEVAAVLSKMISRRKGRDG